jgi:hypothetical protein
MATSLTWALKPRSRNCATALATSSAPRAHKYTLAPAAHSCSAMASPMPRVPPVIRARRPCRLKRAVPTAAAKG